MKRSAAFTLIELLVVLAIISILSSMIFPSLARGREGARRSACSSNMRQLGIALSLYRDDNDSTYPMGYFYTANGTDGGSEGFQHTHWSWLLQPYIKNEQIFVCPSDITGGASPYNCDTRQHPQCRTDQIYGDPGTSYANGGSAGITDRQALHLSYTANEVVLARKRSASTPVNVVLDAAIETPGSVIVMAEASGAWNDNGPPELLRLTPTAPLRC